MRPIRFFATSPRIRLAALLRHAGGQHFPQASLLRITTGLLLFFGLHAAAQSTFEECALAVEPYPHLVIGTVAAIATREQTGGVFEQMRQEGKAQSLPDDKTSLGWFGEKEINVR